MGFFFPQLCQNSPKKSCCVVVRDYWTGHLYMHIQQHAWYPAQLLWPFAFKAAVHCLVCNPHRLSFRASSVEAEDWWGKRGGRRKKRENYLHCVPEKAQHFQDASMFWPVILIWWTLAQRLQLLGLSITRAVQVHWQTQRASHRKHKVYVCGSQFYHLGFTMYLSMNSSKCLFYLVIVNQIQAWFFTSTKHCITNFCNVFFIMHVKTKFYLSLTQPRHINIVSLSHYGFIVHYSIYSIYSRGTVYPSSRCSIYLFIQKDKKYIHIIIKM